MTTRREFLKRSTMLSLSPLVPAFLPRSLAAADPKTDDRVLVVIQLDGGNDGLNMMIPWSDENYARQRHELRIAGKEVLKLDERVGLHPQMRGAARLFEDRRLAVVQGVGYPNPNRSHFESMAIWHHARLDAGQHDGIGWLGRGADVAPRGDGAADSIYVGSEGVPAALRGRRANAVSFENEADLQLNSSAAAEPAAGANRSTDVEAFVARTLASSYAAARLFSESGEARSGGIDGYPSSMLGQKLKLLARLLKLGGGTRLFYVSQSGYDTHAAQLATHASLLRELSGGLYAFLEDLKGSGLADRAAVLVFSEFGRRVQENGSQGTDHGTAAPVLLAGAGVQPGLIGTPPDLNDLDAGDLKMSIDFRRVYAAVLDQWLGIPSAEALGQQFEPLKLFRS